IPAELSLAKFMHVVRKAGPGELAEKYSRSAASAHSIILRRDTDPWSSVAVPRDSGNGKTSDIFGKVARVPLEMRQHLGQYCCPSGVAALRGRTGWAGRRFGADDSKPSGAPKTRPKWVLRPFWAFSVGLVARPGVFRPAAPAAEARRIRPE